MAKKIIDLEQPVARTNMLKIHWDQKSVIKGLMNETSGNLRVLYSILPLTRQKNETDSSYFLRADTTIKQFIANQLGASVASSNYERIAISKDTVLFFYLGQASSNVDDLIEWHLKAGIGLEKAISAILQLKLKISYLEDVSVHYDLSLKDANSAFFIAAMETTDKEDTSIVDSLECNVYYSAYDEIAVSVKSATFKFDKKNTTVFAAATGSVSLHKGSETYLNGDRLSATKSSKRPFMEFKLGDGIQTNPRFANSGYQNSKNYHLTACLNKIINELDSIGITYTPIVFQSTGVIENFVTASAKITNDLVIIDCFNRYPSDEIKHQFREHLKSAFNAVAVIDKNAPNAHEMLKEGTSYLVINPSNKKNGSSIANLTSGKYLNSFWQALAASKTKAQPDFDYYTGVKISRFVDNLNIVCQGIDVKNVTKTVTIKDGNENTDNPTKEVNLNELKSDIIQKAITELWFKESIFHKNKLNFTKSSMADGDYQVFYCRSTKDNIKVCNVVDITISERGMSITNTRRWDASESIPFDMEHSFLQGHTRDINTGIFDSLRDQSFILYQKSTGHSLISYSSGRIPKIIGNALFDNIKLYNERGVARASKADDNPLPYYITTTQAGKMYRVFLQDDGIDGVKYFVSGSKPMNAKIDKQSLINNVLVYNENGVKLNALEQSITTVFFNSFTYNILKNKNSAKKSVLQKVAEIGLEN